MDCPLHACHMNILEETTLLDVSTLRIVSFLMCRSASSICCHFEYYVNQTILTHNVLCVENVLKVQAQNE